MLVLPNSACYQYEGNTYFSWTSCCSSVWWVVRIWSPIENKLKELFWVYVSNRITNWILEQSCSFVTGAPALQGLGYCRNSKVQSNFRSWWSRSSELGTCCTFSCNSGNKVHVCHFSVASYLTLTLKNAGMNTCSLNTASFLSARRDNQFCSGLRANDYE